MKSRWRLAAVASVFLALDASQPAVAQPAAIPPTLDGAALRAAAAHMEQACAAGLDTIDCRYAVMEATPLITQALATVGATRNRAAYAAYVSLYLAAVPAEIRAAAAFALADLFPDAGDTPALLTLLMDPVDGARLAALAALRESSDPTARILVARTGDLGNTGLAPQPLPYDPAALAPLLPADARYVEFERDELRYGLFVFMTGEDLAAALGRLTDVGGRVTPFDVNIPNSFVNSRVPSFMGERQSVADATIIMLDGRGAGPQAALVYRDLQLGRTGIVLAWLPGEEPMPPPPEVAPPLIADPVVAELELAPEDSAAVPSPGAFTPDPAATEWDTAFYELVLAGRGVGGEQYLREFPDGAYRDEVAALLATELIVELAEYRVAPLAPVVISFRNMPGNADDWFTIMPWQAADNEFQTLVTTAGARTGTVVIQAPATPGEYELRVFFETVPVAQQRISFVVDADVAVPAPAAPTLAVAGPLTSTSAIVVDYAGFPATGGDWITIVPIGTPDGTWRDFANTPCCAMGTVTLPAQAPGNYEIRGYVDTPQRRVIARLPVEVAQGAALEAVAVEATLELAAPALAGMTITVRYAGSPNGSGSWITIVPAGTPDEAWRDYVYTPTSPAGTVTLPGQPAGQYELRLIQETPTRLILARLPLTIE